MRRAARHALTRTGRLTFRATSESGATIDLGPGGGDVFSPVELLLAAIAGCTAMDVDAITGEAGRGRRLRRWSRAAARCGTATATTWSTCGSTSRSSFPARRGRRRRPQCAGHRDPAVARPAVHGQPHRGAGLAGRGLLDGEPSRSRPVVSAGPPSERAARCRRAPDSAPPGRPAAHVRDRRTGSRSTCGRWPADSTATGTPPCGPRTRRVIEPERCFGFTVDDRWVVDLRCVHAAAHRAGRNGPDRGGHHRDGATVLSSPGAADRDDEAPARADRRGRRRAGCAALGVGDPDLRPIRVRPRRATARS